MSRYALTATPSPDGVTFQLSRKQFLGHAATIPVAEWATIDDATLALALSRLAAWRNEEAALEVQDGLLVPHALVAFLGDGQAGRFGLPPRPGLALHVQHEGTIDQPGFQLRSVWRSVGGQPLLGVERNGCWLKAVAE